MLPIRLPPDYQKRWPLVVQQGLLRAPAPKDGAPLLILNADALNELSYLFFCGWLFSGILNQAKEVVRFSLVPLGANRDSSLLIIHEAETHLATPSRKQSELLDPRYFTCPLDSSNGKVLTETQKHLCPVVNKLRYNLSHARPDGSVDGLKEPDRTQYCCESKKHKLWNYLASTIVSEPDTYGAMVGGHAFPLALPFDFLEKYLTGLEPTHNDFGKLLEETLLWYGMSTSKVLFGCPHAELKKPIEFHEIDMLLYDSNGDLEVTKDEPPEGWEKLLSSHSICLMELTIGHQSDFGKDAEQGKRPNPGKDVPKNKLLNFQALGSYGFRKIQAHYFSITGEDNLSGAVSRALKTTSGFSYRCMSEEVGEDIQLTVLSLRDKTIEQRRIRSWHARLLKWVEEAGAQFAQ